MFLSACEMFITSYFANKPVNKLRGLQPFRRSLIYQALSILQIITFFFFCFRDHFRNSLIHFALKSLSAVSVGQTMPSINVSNSATVSLFSKSLLLENQCINWNMRGSNSCLDTCQSISCKQIVLCRDILTWRLFTRQNKLHKTKY